MEDYLRPNEFDGIGNMCEIRAIGFMEWRMDVKRFDKNIIRNNPNITVKELYKEYLNTLTTK